MKLAELDLPPAHPPLALSPPDTESESQFWPGEQGSYLLGVLWGAIGCAGDGTYWLRHQDRWYVDFVRDSLLISQQARLVRMDSRPQWRLRITKSGDVARLNRLFATYGWSPRRSEVRWYPNGHLHDRAFIRAWVELHGSADVAVSHGRKTPRLRIYGNVALVETINHTLSRNTGLPLRRVQRTGNETTKALYYLGKTMFRVLDGLYQHATVSNPQARTRLQTPILGYNIGGYPLS